MVLNINTRDRQVINNLHKNQYKVVWGAAAGDMNNHANTNCFGTNFCPIPFTPVECGVSNLLP